MAAFVTAKAPNSLLRVRRLLKSSSHSAASAFRQFTNYEAAGIFVAAIFVLSCSLWPRAYALLRQGPLQRRRSFVPARLPRAHIARASYIAEIVHDRRSHPVVFHCLVRHKKSGEIVRWHQARTREEAERAAQEYLADLAGDAPSQHDRNWLG